MSELVINVETRKTTGSGAARKLRREGKVPGIFYFHGQENIPFTIDQKELIGLLGHESSLIEAVFDKKNKKQCIIREVQFDPLTGSPKHIDLLGIDLKEKISVSVPINLVGIAAGVKNDGGMLEQQLRELEIQCLPGDIPDNIEIDVSELKIGDTIHCADIKMDKIEILEDPKTVIAIVVPPRVATEKELEEEAAEAEEAEPEVIGKSQEQEEE